MSAPTHRIYLAWKELLIYEESPDRKLEFNCDCIEPYQVHIPTPDLWPLKTPLWAHPLRDTIVHRLRAANCIICEVSTTTTSILSPEDTFRVEIYSQSDDRGFPLRALRIITKNNDRLLDLNDAQLTGPVSFPHPGEVILPFNLQSTRYQIAIDIKTRTFTFHPTGSGTSMPLCSSQPLDQLLPTLGSQNPQPPLSLLVPPPPRSLFTPVGQLLICLLFSAAGLWQTLTSQSRLNRCLGLLCTLFFLLCTFAPLTDLKKRIKNRNYK